MTIYLADDNGAGGDGCPTAAADGATTIEVLADAAHVSDLPIPGEKRACAAFDAASDMSLSWLAEVFPRTPAPPSEEEDGSLSGVMLARR